jgi:hypothetical protein
VWEPKAVEEEVGRSLRQTMAMVEQVIAPLEPLEDGGADESFLATPSQ